MRELGELLGDGARPLGKGAAFQVAAQRAEYAHDVNAPVRIKPQILRRQKRLPRVLRHTGKSNHCPVFRAAKLAHALAICIVKGRGLRQSVQALGVEPLPVGHVEENHKGRSKHDKQAQHDEQSEKNTLFAFAGLCLIRHAASHSTEHTFSPLLCPDARGVILFLRA